MEREHTVEIEFEGVDYWGRPIFKDINSKDRYGSCDILVSGSDPESIIRAKISEADLVYFGKSFGCEPVGTPVDDLRIQWHEEKAQFNHLGRPADFISSYIETYLSQEPRVYSGAWRDERHYDSANVLFDACLSDHYHGRDVTRLSSDEIADAFAHPQFQMKLALALETAERKSGYYSHVPIQPTYRVVSVGPNLEETNILKTEHGIQFSDSVISADDSFQYRMSTRAYTIESLSAHTDSPAQKRDLQIIKNGDSVTREHIKSAHQVARDGAYNLIATGKPEAIETQITNLMAISDVQFRGVPRSSFDKTIEYHRSESSYDIEDVRTLVSKMPTDARISVIRTTDEVSSHTIKNAHELISPQRDIEEIER
jgi:hypothetical protein